MSEVKSMKYFIVGYMASGKSTFGKELAKDKGLPFLDLDESVESREGRSISEIFAKEGEEYYMMAVAAARVKDVQVMAVALQKAIQLDPQLKERASTDKEFYPYAQESIYLDIVD